MKVNKSKNNTIKVGNFDIVIGRTYVIEDRPDNSVEEFAVRGLTKYPSKDIGELRQAPFNEVYGMFDTGFSKDDPSNKGRDITESDIAVANAKIRVPFEKKFKKDLEPTNNAFWGEDSLSVVHLYKNKLFNTTIEKDLFDLYQALKHYWVVVKGDRDQRTVGVPYVLVDTATQIDDAIKSASKVYDAVLLFAKLLASSGKDDKLYTILDWMGSIKNSRNMSNDQLQQQFQLNSKREDFCNKFIEISEMYESDKFREEMNNFSTLAQLNSDKKIKFTQGKYYLDGVLIGNSLKEGAKIITESDNVRGKQLREAIADAFKK